MRWPWGQDGGKYRLDLRADPIAKLADAAEMLRDQSRDVGLNDTVCNVVLAPELYSVSLIERPPVAVKRASDSRSTLGQISQICLALD